MQVSELEFLSGEIRKLIMKVTCDDEVCNDFIISTAKAELINKSLTKKLALILQNQEKKLEY